MVYKRYRSGKIKRAQRTIRKAHKRVSRSMTSRGVYHFKRSFRLSQIVFNVGTTSMYGEQFDITQLPNVTEFSNLFDLYKINAIKLELVPCQTGSDTNPPSTSIFLPNIMSAIDYTDSTPPSGINELMQYPGCRRTKITRRHSRYFKPKVNIDVNGVALGNNRSNWMGFGVATPHYGVKWGLDQIFNVPAGQGFGVDRYVTFYFSCKNVR